MATATPITATLSTTAIREHPYIEVDVATPREGWGAVRSSMAARSVAGDVAQDEGDNSEDGVTLHSPSATTTAATSHDQNGMSIQQPAQPP